MGKIIMISSGKDGVGKSSVSALLAETFCKKGKSVLIIEFENGLRSQNIFVNSSESLFDLDDVLSGRCSLGEAISSSSLYSNLKVIFGGNSRSPVDSSLFGPLLLSLADDYDVVIIDSDCSDDTISTVSSYSMYNIIVSTNDISGIKDAKYVSDLLYQNNAPNIRLIINRVVPQYVKNGATENLDYCIDTIGAQLIGVIPENIDITLSTNKGKILNKNSLAQNIFSNIADRLDGLNIPLSYM